MNIPVIVLASLAILMPLSSSAGCYLNGEEVPGDPTLIEGTGGPDYIDCSASPVRHEIYGYSGQDVLVGSDYDDFIAGGGSDDVIRGGEGDDAIDGGGDDDVIYGDGGNDVIFGGVGASPASGVGCEVVLVASGSSYLSKGGSGDDIIYGGDGNDCIDAGSGEDIIHGGDGHDTIEGGNHSDWIDGGLGNDHIDGGWHTDTCTGGGGDDVIDCELDGGPVPFCGDTSCDSDEDSCSCSADCGSPPDVETGYCTDAEDNDCDGVIDCFDDNCSADPACSSTSECNNDGTCEPGEDCENCPNDCAGKTNGKPSGRYCCGDGSQQTVETAAICDGNF